MYSGTPTARSIKETKISCPWTCVINNSEKTTPTGGMTRPAVALSDDCRCFLFSRIVETQVERYVNERRNTELLINADNVPRTLATNAVEHIRANPMYGV